MEKHLHIIALNVPFPVDYGGVVDLFWKLPSLQAQGVHIHLHCFDYGRGQQPILKKYCASVNYYERQQGHKGFSTSVPYIVASRKHEGLLNRLLEDDYPILMEGVHCTWLLKDPRFAKRRKFVRIHNVEHKYYQRLFQNSTGLFRKLYYANETRLLKKYEHWMADKATAYWGVTHEDVNYYRQQLNCNTIDYLPVYLPEDWKVSGLEGMGSYCLYHGDLSVPANEQQASWLLKEVFGKLKIPFVIAGKNPSDKLQELAHQQQHTCIVANPSELEMQDMIRKAHIHVLPSTHTTGIQIKLLNALYNGRHCVVNDAMVQGTGLEAACFIGNSANAMQEIIAQLHYKPFTDEELKIRERLLGSMFSNEANARQQVKWIWGE